MCEKLNISCIHIPNQHHRTLPVPSIRHSQSLNFITKYMISCPDKYFMLDSDMFFVDLFDIAEFEDYYFCYVSQTRTIRKKVIEYPWANLFYINIHDIPNTQFMDWSVDIGLDTGGKCAAWLSSLDTHKTLKLNWLGSCKWDANDMPSRINKHITLFVNNDVRNVDGKYFSELYFDKLLHYRGASNWMEQSQQMHTHLVHLLKSALCKM